MEPFAVKDCTLIPVAAGERAHDLRELRDALQRVPSASIYHHFWAGLLRPIFDDMEYRNDFASWVERDLRDQPLAERLAIVTPSDFDDMESLRQEVVEIIEDRLDEADWVSWLRSQQPFFFSMSTLVIFDTGTRVTEPRDLMELIPGCSAGTVFYHFIDARRRTDSGQDDFSLWVEAIDGLGGLVAELRHIDPHGRSLTDLRTRLHQAFIRHL